jgi:DNA-3-methyladenine glycosylase I
VGDGRQRCGWPGDDALMVAYHDDDWGVPVHDDRLHFELIILEGAQAGLSWRSVLQRRESYRAAFAGFDPRAVAAFTAADQERLLQDAGIIRNRKKIESAIRNANAFLEVQAEHGSFDAYVWQFVGGEPRRSAFRALSELPAETEQSTALSKDLRARGFNFVGATICYAYMQSAGLVNDHLVSCFRYDQVARQGP